MTDSNRYTFSLVDLQPYIVTCKKCQFRLWTHGQWILAVNSETARYAVGCEVVCPHCSRRQKTVNVYVDPNQAQQELTRLQCLGLGTHPPPLLPLALPSVDVDLSDTE